MSFIQNLFSSRDNNANTQTYVGQTDRIWYNPDNNTFRVSDGSTPGGLPIDYSSNANITANQITANSITVSSITSTSGTVAVTGNLTITGNISPASNVKIGGIVAGPGVVIGNTGILTIDSANLPVSFGNFFANNNILTIVNMDEDMILATQGSAEIQLVGNVGFYKTNGGGVPDPADRYFFAKEDGQIFFYISDEDPLEAAIDIVGTTSGNVIPPGITGAMLQVTGQANIPCRIYYDGVNNYVSWVARRYNGNVAAPTQVLAGEDVLRINATAATNAGGGNVGNVAMAQISMSALENQTATAQGSEIVFTVTPVGSAATSRVEVATVTVADGVTATKFTTAGTVSATGNITGGNLITGGLLSVTGNITGGNIATAGITSTGSLTASTTISATGNITGGNVSATNYTGLVTHSIRNAGVVTGTTLTLNVTTDDIVKCTFSDAFTVAFSNIVAGRVITLLATNTSAGDTDIITAGISSVNMQGDNTLTVTQQTTAVITYYSLDGDTANIYASAVYA
jgi:hypothetical protein